MTRPALRCTICGTYFPAFGFDKPARERAAYAYGIHACAFNRRVEGETLQPQLVSSRAISRPRVQFHPAGGAS
jgi:hypothetical protein